MIFVELVKSKFDTFPTTKPIKRYLLFDMDLSLSLFLSLSLSLSLLSMCVAEDFLCKRLVDMRGGIVDLGKQAVLDQNHLSVDHQNQVNVKKIIVLGMYICNRM